MFMFFEPLEKKRRVVVTDQRTALDWADQIRNLVDREYPRGERITLVMEWRFTNEDARVKLKKLYPTL